MRNNYITPEEITKALSKIMIENRNLSVIEKEMLKHAVDSSHNWCEVLSAVALAGMIEENRRI